MKRVIKTINCLCGAVERMARRERESKLHIEKEKHLANQKIGYVRLLIWHVYLFV